MRDFCHERGLAYAMAVPVDLPLVEVRGQAGCPGHLLDRQPALGDGSMWERRSCGAGTKGARVYDWAVITVTLTDQAPAAGFTHTLLLRRSIADPTKVEFFLTHVPPGTSPPPCSPWPGSPAPAPAWEKAPEPRREPPEHAAAAPPLPRRDSTPARPHRPGRRHLHRPRAALVTLPPPPPGPCADQPLPATHYLKICECSTGM